MLKNLRNALLLLLVFSFSTTLLGNETAKKYFPATLGSHWVYEDQDGNELTRRAIEGEELAGKMFPAFTYEPELENWIDYNLFIHPYLYQVNEAGIALVVGDETKNAFKASFENEMDILVRLIKGQVPFIFDMDVEIQMNTQELMFLLPNDIVFNEEWDVNHIEANVKLSPVVGDGPEEPLIIDYTITETGIILGTENVETAAGVFEDCLKVEYRTETTTVFSDPPPPDQVKPPGETVTTVWFAPNVGIVQLQQKSRYLFLDMLTEEAEFPLTFPPKQEKTLELKRYEITETESSDSD